MQITPEEIESVEEIGTLDGNKVRLLRTRGGWYCATGRKKGSLQDEALAAGSHGAIVKFNLEKQNPGYQPTLMKSESLLNPTIVMDHSHLLDSDLIKSGHDIYSVQTGQNIEFQITKHDIKIGSMSSIIEDGNIKVKELSISPEFKTVLAIATAEKAFNCGISSLESSK